MLKTNRGIISKTVDEEISEIARNGSKTFRDFMLDTKAIGIAKGAKIASLEVDKQNEFVVWMYTRRRTRNAVDLKIAELMD